MIYKRYQYWGIKGITWTKWFPYTTNESITTLKRLEKWQIKNKLLNQFKEVNEDISK